jgi:hypothetical protein
VFLPNADKADSILAVLSQNGSSTAVRTGCMFSVIFWPRRHRHWRGTTSTNERSNLVLRNSRCSRRAARQARADRAANERRSRLSGNALGEATRMKYAAVMYSNDLNGLALNPRIRLARQSFPDAQTHIAPMSASVAPTCGTDPTDHRQSCRTTR